MSELLVDVQAWVKYLNPRPLPVRNSVIQRLKSQLKDENIPLSKINTTIKSDPVLCLHVVRKAAIMHQQKDSKISGIDHAISSLGLTHINEVAKDTEVIKLNPAHVAQKMYFRSISLSHHAATQATCWLQARKAGFIDETFLATLFYGVGYWMLWRHAPLHMVQIEILIREKGLTPNAAELEVLGCSIQEISKGLISHWGISELAVTSLEHETSPNKKTLAQLHQRALGDPRISEDELREINHLVQEKFFPVKLANWLAFSASFGWQQAKTMKVIDIINDYLKSEIADTISTLHQNCVSSSRLYHVAGTLAPATEMLMLNSDKQINYRLSKKEQQLLRNSAPIPQPPKSQSSSKPQPQPKSTPQGSLLNTHIYDQITERFFKGYEQYDKPKHILQAMMQALSKGIGFERSALFLIDNSKHLKTALQIGFDSNHPIAKFTYDIKASGLLAKLTEKPACIWVKPDNREKMLKALPKTYSDWANPEGFILLSLFLGAKPIAVIYCDNGKIDNGISSFHNDKLRYLSSAASLSLRKLSQLKPKQA